MMQAEAAKPLMHQGLLSRCSWEPGSQHQVHKASSPLDDDTRPSFPFPVLPGTPSLHMEMKPFLDPPALPVLVQLTHAYNHKI